MFQKPFHIKSQTVLKGSDRKKIRAEICAQSPMFTNEILSEILPQKSDVQQAKISLHNGDQATVILAAKQPVFFEYSCIYYPTVYTAWNYPQCFNLFPTWQPVIQKLYGGADLMLPGVVVSGEITLNTFSHIRKSLPVGVNVPGNRAVLAIGETCMNGEEMYLSGMRGKGVAIRHFYGDHLWALGSKVSPPQIADPTPELALSDCSTKQLESDTQALQLEEGAAGDEGGEAGACADPGHPGSADTEDSTDVVSDDKPTFNSLAEDEKLYQCFLYALKKKVKKTQLPMLTSGFYRDCLQICVPPGSTVDIKKTKYKKLISFLNEMQKQKFLTVKETAKGVHSVTDYEPAHPELRSFSPWELPDVEETIPDDTQEYVYEPPQIVELLAVNAQTLPLFSTFGLTKGDVMSLSEMRQAVTEYVKNKNLQQETNKQMILLDEALTKAVVTKKDGFVEYMKWNILFERLSNALAAVYKITYSNGAITIKKGKPPPVKVKLETRTGNKKVTIITNLDKFGIDLKELAKELRSSKACSTSIQEERGDNFVLAQGNHATFIHKLLKERYKIPIKYLDIPT